MEAVLELINDGQFRFICCEHVSCCIMFKPKCKKRVVAHEFQYLTLSGLPLMYVECLKYLNHIICNTLSDVLQIHQIMYYK